MARMLYMIKQPMRLTLVSSRMPLDEHYEYALYMYHIQSVRDLATNNRMLLLIASLEIQLGKYDHATQTITQISVGKCTPVQLKQLYFMQILLAAEVGDTDTKNQFLKIGRAHV